jgi:hypothetical protein
MTTQKDILKLFVNDEFVLSKSFIVLALGNNYYCNAEKHIGDMLSRMVKNGTLIRIKKGVFKRGSSVKKQNTEFIDENQISLF